MSEEVTAKKCIKETCPVMSGGGGQSQHLVKTATAEFAGWDKK